jgi:prepilin-type processing-associated H-X9-DG protein
VIAIIGILAAMLFPVFARARESARKIQCLSNVKNIAMAIAMYVGDYQAFPPKGGLDQAAEDYFGASNPHGYASDDWRITCGRCVCKANPYARWPVILDEYTKNRDIWRCPSARASYGPTFIFPQVTPVWWQYYQQTAGEWTTDAVYGPCVGAFPPGWGGDVTDSIAQQMLSGAGGYRGSSSGAPELTIGVIDQFPGLKESSVSDTSHFIVCGDSQDPTHIGEIGNPALMMYGMCGMNYFSPQDSCAVADYGDCPWTTTCGIEGSDSDAVKAFSDPSVRSKWTRHLGGANVGFMDGHAKWYAADAFMSQVPYCECCSDETGGEGSTIHTENRPLRGVCPSTAGT